MYEISNLGYGNSNTCPCDLGVMEAYGKYNPWVLSKQLIKEAKTAADWQTARILERTGKSIQSQVNTSISTIAPNIPGNGMRIEEAKIQAPVYTPSTQVTPVMIATATPQINRIVIPKVTAQVKPEWPKIYKGKQVYSQAEIDRINTDAASKAELDRRLKVMRQQEYAEQKAISAQKTQEARALYAQKQREEQQALIAKQMQVKIQETKWVPFAPSMPAEAFYYATRKSPGGSIQSIRGNR